MEAELSDQNKQRSLHAESFGSAADRYERGRPSYPNSAVDWLLPVGGRTAVDLGAGTGQLTRVLNSYDLDVVAVEPLPEMREGLSERHLNNVRIVAGRAESIPLPNTSADVVLVAQAWHWFDAALAVPEIARVLSPGGRLGLLWNIRDERVEWVAELGRIMHEGSAPDLNSENPRVGDPFDPIERFDVEWKVEMDRSALLDMVASRSYFITSPEAEQVATLKAVDEFLTSHPQLRGSASIVMPYITRCSRTNLSR